MFAISDRHTPCPQKIRQTSKTDCGKNAGFRREMVGETENHKLYILIPFLYLSFIFPVFPYQNPQKNYIYIYRDFISFKIFKGKDHNPTF